MKCNVVLKSEAKKKWDALVVGFYEGDKSSLASLGKLDREKTEFFEEIFKAKQFQGKDSEHFFTYLPGFKLSHAVLLVGLGKPEKYDAEKMKCLFGRVYHAANRHKLVHLAFDLKSVSPQKIASNSQETSRAAMEALVLSSFNFNKYKTQSKSEASVQTVDLLCVDALEKKEMLVGVRTGKLIGEAVNIARELASEPSNFMTPRKLAERAQELAEDAKLNCKILEEDEIREEKMGGIIGVAQGSKEPPRFIILETKFQDPSQKPIILVGKGITFDSGGISLKPADGMEKMKYDMSGAAAVIATLWLIGKLGLKVPVIGIAPTCENLPSEAPQKPGDIITISNGKTVEVINTDAEGRLILADGLSYAVKQNPRYIIDLATLTGSCRATFGEYAIGMMGNNRTLLDAIKEAGEKSGERCWELPLWDDYKPHIKSEFADIKNVGKGTAGAISAGKFLEEFVGESAWVHLDIASTGWFDESHDYISRGSSGAGVRLIAQFLKTL